MYNSCEWIRYECASLLVFRLFLFLPSSFGYIFVCRSIAASHLHHRLAPATFNAIFVRTKFRTEFLLRCSIMHLTFTTHFIIKIIIGDRACFALLSLCHSSSLVLIVSVYTIYPISHSYNILNLYWIHFGCRNDFALPINNFNIITLASL